LQISSFYGQSNTLKALIVLGAETNTIGGRWGTSLQAAATEGLCEVILSMTNAGAEVPKTGVGKYGNALSAAVMKKSIDAVKLLREHGADPNISAGKGCAINIRSTQPAYCMASLKSPSW